MTDNNLLVMVPTRGRRTQCEQLLESFTRTATCSDLLFILDADDQDTYDGMNWEPGSAAVLEPREYLSSKMNKTALAMADIYPVLMWIGDDNVFITPGWDEIMLAAMDGLGGTGWVYADDKRRSDVPEHWMVSSDMVDALGWFYPPHVQHYYGDNSVAELGKRSGLIRWCPEAVIEHRHYTVTAGVERDAVYNETEDKFAQSDRDSYTEWHGGQMGNDVALLRRRFSPDVSWVLSKIA